MMDELSENLKKAMKKYNDIDNDNDLSIIPSDENEESKSNQFNSNKITENNLINATRKIIEGNHNNNSINNNNNNNLNKITNNNFYSHFNKTLSKLDDFEININKDFKELEEMIETIIEKDLKYFSK